MTLERDWEYNGYECRTWITTDGNIKFYAVKETKENTDWKSGLLISPQSDKTEDKLDSGVEELEENITADIQNQPKCNCK